MPSTALRILLVARVPGRWCEAAAGAGVAAAGSGGDRPGTPEPALSLTPGGGAGPRRVRGSRPRAAGAPARGPRSGRCP